MQTFFHSVRLEREKCKGCINCMKRCPTEAIRVREGKAFIISERCIDCGECIRICPNHAKKSVCDPLDSIAEYRWRVALPAPSFYGQFLLDDINVLLAAFLRVGFNDVFEVSRAAEIVTHLTRKKLAELRSGTDGPIISSACPVVARLIRVRFPELCENVLPVCEPFQLAAQMAREEAVRKTGFSPADIGVFFISPCPAKVTSAKSPIGLNKSYIDGVLSSSELYLKLLPELKKVDQPENRMQSGVVGINWAASGGECAGLLSDRSLAADGIENVIQVLEEIEGGKLSDLDFVELNACPGGCVGGVLNVTNGFVARSRIKTLRRYLPLTQNKLSGGDRHHMLWEENLPYAAVYRLDDDMGAAMAKMKQIDAIARTLPGLDCGTCGAPSCRAFAEDIVRGEACLNDCVIRFSDELARLGVAGVVPAPFRRHEHADTPSASAADEP